MVSGPGYPPERHVLRSIGLEIEPTSLQEHRGRVRATELGSVTTALDVLAGSLCGRVVAPDWMATSSMQLHLWGDPAEVTDLHASVSRAGRTTVCVRVDLSHGPEAPPSGTAMVTFARLPRRESNLSIEVELDPGTVIRFGPAPEGDPAPEPFGELVGTTLVDPTQGITSTDLGSAVRNSFGAMNGGVVASVVAAAASSLTGRTGADVVDLDIDFLGQATVGPVHSSAELLDDTLGSLVRVELRDAGRLDDGGAARLTTIGHVRLS